MGNVTETTHFSILWNRNHKILDNDSNRYSEYGYETDQRFVHSVMSDDILDIYPINADFHILMSNSIGFYKINLDGVAYGRKRFVEIAEVLLENRKV